MSLRPAFEIGLANAWILMVVLFAAAFLPLFTATDTVEKRMEGEPSGSETKTVSRVVNVITHMIIMPLTMIYSIFLPIESGTWWFYVGLPIYIAGLTLVLSYSISFAKAPLGEPITQGGFAISRNPSYLGFFLAYFGVGVACASWIILLCALAWIISWHYGVPEEERIMIEKYGDRYREYMKRTPRWIGFPKNQ